ncbi:MAG: response regulator transcription factor [Clostridia bacterium]|nr:response regulator transcription factor [Clostridia bacterium]
METTILLVEDNEAIILGLEYLFKEEKINLKTAKNKKEAKKIIEEDKEEQQKINLILLDITLPDGNGFDLCKYIKRETSYPVIFLTSREEEKDVVEGLEIGAEDYIIKPFRNRELISRIKNVLRRNEKNNNEIKCKDIKIDIISGKVYREDQEIILTKLEYKILLNLFTNMNKLISREEILNDIWDVAGNFVNDNTLTVYIKRIREKIGDKNGEIIETVRGLGYRVENK